MATVEIPSLLDVLMMPGRRSYTADDIPSPPLVFVSGVPCLRVGDGDRVAVYLHGNYEDLGTVWRFATVLADRLECTLYVPEYRGYGIHRGPPSPAKTVSDVRRVLRRVARHHGDGVHVLGYSIGTAVASAAVATNRDVVASLTLLAPLHSAHTMVEHYASAGIASLMASDHVFDSARWLQRYGKPVFIVHGMDDRIVPFSNALKLQRDLGPRKVVLHALRKRGHAMTWDTPLLDNIDAWWKFSGLRS